MAGPQIGQVKVREDFPQFLFHDKLDGHRRVDTAFEKAEAVREGWRLGYRHQEFPKAMYNALGEMKECANQEEVDALKAEGWEENIMAFSDAQIVGAKIMQEEALLKALKEKRKILLEQGGVK